MDLSMWRRALTRGAPALTREQWDALDPVARWLIATRAQVLVMTLLSAALGGLWALRDGRFVPGRWALVAAGLVLAHATNNLVNDLTDFLRGVDKDNYFRAQYGPQPLAHGLMTIPEMLGYIAGTGGAALAIGVYLMAVAAHAAVAWALFGSGVFFVLFYTWPLKYIGLGELAVLAVWGPLMIGGTYFMVAGRWDWGAVVAGLPYALGTTGVIFGKHIDKLAADRAKGIRTLPVLLGEAAARWAVLGMLAAQYVLVGALVLARFFTPALLLVLLAVPTFRLVARAYRQPRPAAPPEEFPKGVWPLWFVAFAFEHNRRFGLWFVAGLVIDLLLRR